MNQEDLTAISELVSQAVRAEVAPLKADVALMKGDVSALHKEVEAIHTSLTQERKEIAAFRAEANTKLDDVYDAIQEVMGELADQSDRKVTKLRDEFEPRLRKLEQLQP